MKAVLAPGDATPYSRLMSDPSRLTAPSQDGRSLEIVTSGPHDGVPLIYHSGTPSGAAVPPKLTRAADERGLRVVTYSRPGYGGSSPRPPGRVADDVDDVDVVLAAVGADDFVTLGWSGGGPRSLACAALRPERCRAAAVLAGVAPYAAAGLDWFAGMAQDNLDEFGAALAGPDDLAAFLEDPVAAMTSMTAEQVVEGLGDLLPDVDRRAVTGELGTYLAGSFRRAVAQGVVGWRDDDRTLIAPWGFDVADITVPVTIWQGGQDRMVPYTHGQWLAAHVRGARVRLFDQEGHISLTDRFGEILDDVVDLAGLPGAGGR